MKQILVWAAAVLAAGCVTPGQQAVDAGETVDADPSEAAAPDAQPTERHEFSEPPRLVFEISIKEKDAWRTLVVESQDRFNRYSASVDLNACASLAPDLGIGATHRYLHVLDGSAAQSMRVVARTDYPVKSMIVQLKAPRNSNDPEYSVHPSMVQGRLDAIWAGEDNPSAIMYDDSDLYETSDAARTVEFEFAMPRVDNAPSWATVYATAYFETSLGTVFGDTKMAFLSEEDCVKCDQENPCPNFGMDAYYLPDDEAFWQDEDPEGYARWKAWKAEQAAKEKE